MFKFWVSDSSELLGFEELSSKHLCASKRTVLTIIIFSVWFYNIVDKNINKSLKSFRDEKYLLEILK